MTKLSVFFSVIIPALFVACETQSPEFTTLNLGFRAVGNAPDHELNLRSSNGEGIFIDTAILILERIDLDLKDAEDTPYDPGNYILRGPYEIDLISKKSKPELLQAEISPGIYDVLRAMLHIPAGHNFSIYVTGTYTMNEKWWRFRYECNEVKIFRAESLTGVEIIENASNNIWILIDVVALFDGVDFSRAAVGPDNIIRISSTTNSGLARIVSSNFEVAAVVDDGNDLIGDDDEPDDTDDDEIPGGDTDGDDGDNYHNGGDDGSYDGNDRDEGDNADDQEEDDGDEDEGSAGRKEKDKDKDKDKDKHRDKEKDKHKDKNKNKDKDKDNDKEDDDD